MQARKKLGKRFYISTAVTAAAIAALLWNKCGTPKQEPLLDCKTNVCEAHPAKGDGRCEINKAEADHTSDNFDPKSCGYCGDGIRQIKADNGSGIVLDLDTLQYFQEVTERPSETPENCPVDFHCGNKRPEEFRAAYAAILEKDGKYSVGKKLVTESCNANSDNYCEYDCRYLRRGKEEEPEQEEEPEPEKPKSYALWTCPDQIGVNSREVVSSNSAAARSVLRRIVGAIKDKAIPIREALETTANSDVHATVLLRVSPSGSVSTRNVMVSCSDEGGKKTKTVNDLIVLSFEGMAIGAPGSECYWTVTVKVP